MNNQNFELAHNAYLERVEDNTTHQADELLANAQGAYGDFIALPFEAGINLLKSRESSRTRGILAIVGYELVDGPDPVVANQASVTMEMLQTSLAMIDDIQDSSKSRRGELSAHSFVTKRLVEKGVKLPKGLSEGVTINGALQMGYLALSVLGRIEGAPADKKIDALNTIGDAYAITGFGQTGDMLAPFVSEISNERVAKANADKTKHYTFWVPLALGMTLGGADDKDTSRIRTYADNMGEVYQLKNDLIDNGTDILAGKRTLATLHALGSKSLLDDYQKHQLDKLIGDPSLTSNKLTRAKKLIVESGVEQVIVDKTKVATESLNDTPKNWASEPKEFLVEFANKIAG